MQSILSIQSHVAYGYVGNRAAVFPLQRLGFDVTAINTVQFSNHTGYGAWEGDVFTPEHIQKLIKGLRNRGLFETTDALLTGYMGDPALGQLLRDLALELKHNRPDCLYCCDPVIGDTTRGVFVRPGVGEFFKDHLIEVADILTPNLFELNYLTGMPVTTLSEVKAACDTLIQRGPHTILVTSAILEDTPDHQIEMIVHTPTASYRVQTPCLSMDPLPNGAGDLAAALFLAHTLEGQTPKQALAKLANSIYGIFEATYQAGSRELQLIKAQNELINPSQHFKVIDIS